MNKQYFIGPWELSVDRENKRANIPNWTTTTRQYQWGRNWQIFLKSGHELRFRREDILHYNSGQDIVTFSRYQKCERHGQDPTSCLIIDLWEGVGVKYQFPVTTPEPEPWMVYEHRAVSQTSTETLRLYEQPFDMGILHCGACPNYNDKIVTNVCCKLTPIAALKPEIIKLEYALKGIVL